MITAPLKQVMIQIIKPGIKDKSTENKSQDRTGS
jgi:hypothetical protein